LTLRKGEGSIVVFRRIPAGKRRFDGLVDFGHSVASVKGRSRGIDRHLSTQNFEEIKMAIQKKSLITNLSSTKKALVATSSSIVSASPTTKSLASKHLASKHMASKHMASKNAASKHMASKNAASKHLASKSAASRNLRAMY
jgi:hypothetical protein